MSLPAYLNNIRTKTGKGPDDFKQLAFCCQRTGYSASNPPAVIPKLVAGAPQP